MSVAYEASLSLRNGKVDNATTSNVTQTLSDSAIPPEEHYRLSSPAKAELSYVPEDPLVDRQSNKNSQPSVAVLSFETRRSEFYFVRCCS